MQYRLLGVSSVIRLPFQLVLPSIVGTLLRTQSWEVGTGRRVLTEQGGRESMLEQGYVVALRSKKTQAYRLVLLLTCRAESLEEGEFAAL